MRFEYQILAAIALDLLFGDPQWFPHPVRFIGRFAMAIESPYRKLIPNPRAAGILAALTVILTTGLLSFGLIYGAHSISPILGTAVSVLFLYTSIAARDLARHGMNVYRALKSGDIQEARRRVSYIVGRDTDVLDENGVVRATVESVAENTVDGVTAPLFYAILGGPVAVMVYKAMSTLDSTFGYKNDRYLQFGWASARVDDLANYIPARLTIPLIALAAAVLGMRPLNALRICRRDGRKHASPNSGLSESAMAGALGVQLGGPVYRKGELFSAPLLGDPIVTLGARHIPAINRLMYATSGITVAVLLGLRHVIHVFFG
jgi:adenosylcobinamide-phosphate synthase